MGEIIVKEGTLASVATPSSGYTTLTVDSASGKVYAVRNDGGRVEVDLSAQIGQGYAHYATTKTLDSVATSAQQSLTDETWNTINLTAEIEDSIGCTISSNQVTVPAGTYMFEYWTLVTDNASNGGFSALYDATASSFLVIYPEFASTGSSYQGSMAMPRRGQFTVGSSTDLEIRFHPTHGVMFANQLFSFLPAASNPLALSMYLSELKLWKVT